MAERQRQKLRNKTNKLGTYKFLPLQTENWDKIRVSISGKQWMGRQFHRPAFLFWIGRRGPDHKWHISASSFFSPPTCTISVIWASQEADQALALLDLLLNLIAGGGDLSLSREDSADKGEHSATHGGVKGPAHGAETGAVRRRVWSAVQLDLVWTPASRVQHQT